VVPDRTGFDSLAQVLSDSSLYAAALWTPSNSCHNDPDEQKTGDDGQDNEQIKNLLRHCFGRHLEQCRGRYEMEERVPQIGDGFPESPRMANVRMPQLYG
jgi:hypothetical protein